jgi:hypothetical protein
LFNGVVHIYNHIDQETNQELNVLADGLSDNARDVLDEVMEYEPSGIVPYINDHIFDGNNDDEADDDHDEIIHGLDISMVQSKPCIIDLQELGWEEIDKLKVKEVRQHAKDRQCQKHDIMKYIMVQVINMQSTSTGVILLCKEKVDVVESMWTN